MLTGAVGGNKAHWLKLIGPVSALPLATNVKSNWSISPIATGEELRAIVTAAEILRNEHPYVSGGGNL
jgi:hypothetical protein